MRRLTLDKLKAEHPDVYEAAGAESVQYAAEIIQAERERIMELDQIKQPETNPINSEINAIIERAKYETGQHATDISIEILKLKAEVPEVVARRQMSRIWYVEEHLRS